MASFVRLASTTLRRLTATSYLRNVVQTASISTGAQKLSGTKCVIYYILNRAPLVEKNILSELEHATGLDKKEVDALAAGIEVIIHVRVIAHIWNMSRILLT